MEEFNYIVFNRAVLIGGSGMSFIIGLLCTVLITLMAPRRSDYDAKIGRMLGGLAAFDAFVCLNLTAYFAFRYAFLPAEPPPTALAAYWWAIAGYFTVFTALVMPGILGLVLSIKSRK